MKRPRKTKDQRQAQMIAALAIGGGGSGGPVAWADVTGKPTFGTASAQDIAFFAAASHSHAQSDITGLVTALSGKAATSHSHIIADVTGLQTALDGKQASGSYAAASHTHPQSDITNLTTDLAAKQASLVSGTNIKTINGSSLLGSGNLVISGGGSPLIGWFA
jgi:hypothetical protein